MGTPAAGPADVIKEVTISVEADGTPVCTPLEITARRGEFIRWVGVAHSGEFVGRIRGEKQKGFKKEELSGLDIDPSEKPFAPVKWPVSNVRVQIKQDAKPGAYKYNITVAGVELDPVVIIEDHGGDDPPQ